MSRHLQLMQAGLRLAGVTVHTLNSDDSRLCSEAIDLEPLRFGVFIIWGLGVGIGLGPQSSGP